MALRTYQQIRNAPVGRHVVATAAGTCGFEKDVDEAGAGFYFVRVRVGLKQPKMRLGRFVDISPIEACEAAGAARKRAKQGVSPTDERKREKASNLARKGPVLFREALKACAEARVPLWKHETAEKWIRGVVRYGVPVIGDMAVDDIAPEHLVAIRRAATAAGAPVAGREVQGTIKVVLDYSAAMGWRNPSLRNPADAAAMAAAYPTLRKIEHFRRPDLNSAPTALRAFWASREHKQGAARTAVECFTLMAACALRPREALNLEWIEVDLKERRVAIQARRMKAGVEHALPLSAFACEILKERLEANAGEFVFAGRGGTPIGWATFHRAIRDAEVDLATAHGWRSVFADWCADRAVPRVDRDLREAALAHALPTVEASYRRETGIEARRPVMQRYSEWLIGVEADVVQLPKRA